VLVAAALIGVWEVLASQAPGTTFHVRGLPAPIERLRREAFDLGLLLLFCGLLLGERGLSGRVLYGLRFGAALVLGAGLYAAASGMTGLQISDLRPDASWVFALKMLGRGLIFAGCASIGMRVLVHEQRS
jgi:uncharacterized RDD family membrane protein YckC